jgi:hypothetical protein
MGKQLFEMYDEAKKLGGLGAQIRLAILTMIPSSKAMDATDSEENIKKFKMGIEIVRKEYKQTH